METDAVREAMRRQPFQPFVLRLTDGRELVVSLLGSLAVMRRGVAFVSPVDHSISIIPASEIASVEFFQASHNGTGQQPTKASSGQRKLGDSGTGGSFGEENAMRIDAIRAALHEQPFRPFTLRLADGRELPVPHPDFVAILGRTAVVANPRLDDSYCIVEPLLIVSIDYAGATTQPASETPTGGNP
jgi:hypothetical protein